jgi:hypothetical protein
MKKKTIYLSLIIFAITVLTKDLKANESFLPDSTKQKKWFWGIYFSGNFCYRYVDKHPVGFKDNYNPRFCYNLGFTIERKITKTFFINSGLIIRNHNLWTKDSIYFSSIYHFTYRYYSLYGTIPLQLSYKLFPDYKYSLFVGIGISPCFKIYGKELEASNEYKHSTFHYYFSKKGEGYNVPILESFGSIGLVQNYNKIKLATALYSNYSLITMPNYPRATSEHIYSMGISMNLIF